MMKKTLLTLALLAGFVAMAAPSVIGTPMVFAQESFPENVIEQSITIAAQEWQISSFVLWQEYEDGILTITVTETEVRMAREVAGGGGMMILILDDASF